MSDELQRLRTEVEALRLANAALEAQMLAGAEQSDAMLREVETQRNALRAAHQGQRTLSGFVQRVMDTAGSLVIVLGPDGRVRMANRRCEEALGEAARDLEGRVLDELLPVDERMTLATRLPPLPWQVLSPLFETVRRQGNYSAEHRLAGCNGHYRHYLFDAAMLHDPQGKEEGAVINATDITLLKQQEARLRRSESLLKEAQRLALMGSWELDPSSNKLSWSDEVFRIFEIDPKRFGASYEAFLDAIHPDDRARVNQAYTDSLRTRQEYDLVHRLLFAGGRVKWVHERCVTHYADDGSPLRSVGTVQDVTAQHEADESLRLAATVFDSSLNGILITSPQGIILRVNQAFSEITGYSAQEAVGQRPSLLKSEQHDTAFYRTMWASLERSGSWQGEIWDRHRDGHVIPMWQSITAVRDAKGDISHYIGIFYDITEQKRAAEHIDRLAHYDALTDLPNRLLFNERCGHALERARREHSGMAVLFLDLDHFKHVNDSLGHPMGDALLQAVAQRLKQQLREEDTVARLGGDEFVVILEKVAAAADAEWVARKLLEAFSEPFPVRGHDLSLGLSIGISIYPEDGEDVTNLVKNADIALYRAKEHGRGNFQFFEPHLTQIAAERLYIEGELRQAIRRQELTAFYQPQHTLSDGRLVGAEALLRWKHPELGQVAPDRFIPIAEDSGLIVPIGEWMLATACRQAKAWIDSGHPLERMAVNLSGVQIQRGDIVATISRVLAETGLPPERLELEITETYIMRQAERDIRVLEDLRDLGVKLAIDDFGTGQSSLGYLKRLPVDKLKIDRSFVMDIPQDADDAAITRAIVALGHSLRLNVLAEGVETPEQEVFLKELGCDGVQGYYYSKPVDAAAFEAYRG